MKAFTHLQHRIFDTPLAIHPSKLDAILSGIGPRLGIDWTAENVKELALTAGQWSEPADRKAYTVTEDGIACISVAGTLMKKTSGLMAMSGCSSYEKLSSQITQACADSSVRGILFDIDSPGGETHGMFELSDLIYSARGEKPIYAVANDGAMSAAYVIASAADRIFVTRTGAVGSIGVFGLHVDQSGADEKQGLKYSYIHAGRKKTEGNPHEPLSRSARSDIQAEVDREYDMFVATVARNRGQKADAIQETEAGVYFAESAIPMLADEVGTFEQALSALVEKATGVPSRFSAGTHNKSLAAIAAEQAPAATNPKGESMAQATTDDLAIDAKKGEDAEETKKKHSKKADDADDMKCEDTKEEEDEEPKKKSKKATSAKKAEPKDEEEDDEDDEEDEKEKAAKKAAASGVDAVAICNLCTLAGKPALAAEFISKGFNAKKVQSILLEKRSQEASGKDVNPNFGTAGRSSGLDEMYQQANALVTNSGGKLTRSQALAQALAHNPGLYKRYLSERPTWASSDAEKEQYLADLSQRMPSFGLTRTRE